MPVLLQPDLGPSYWFLAASKQRGVLERIHEDQALFVCSWVPPWSREATDYLASLTGAEVIAPPKGKLWQEAESYNDHNEGESTIAEAVVSPQNMTATIADVFPKRAGQCEVVETLAEAFSDFATRQNAERVGLKSTSYKAYQADNPGLHFDSFSDTENDVHGDLFINFSTRRGSTLVDLSHPHVASLPWNKKDSQSIAAQPDALLQLPELAITIWRGNMPHGSPLAERPAPRRFIQGCTL